MKITYGEDLCKIEVGQYRFLVEKVLGEIVEKLWVENQRMKKQLDAKVKP